MFALKVVFLFFYLCWFLNVEASIIRNAKFTIKNYKKSPQYNISKVHVIFMNHLDVGFDGIYPKRGLINNVLNTYFTEYFPRAVNVSQSLQANGYMETFKYTTHPWLLDLYFNCPDNLVLSGIKLICPTDKEKALLSNAIQNGIIQWHAGAMNIQYENNNAVTLRMGLKVAKNLDRMFNIKRKASMLSHRDIPGLTKALIPYLVEENILGITNGINVGCPPADLPKRIVRWQFNDQEVIYMHTAGGYPNNPGTSPIDPGGLSADTCQHVDGIDEVMCFAFRTDNSGPPEDYKEVLSNYEIIRSQFPNANIFASSLEDFLDVLLKNKEKIPVFTKEIGDTWIQGAASDPLKVSKYKVVQRVLQRCFDQQKCSFDDSRIANASRFLVKIGEHTLGLDSVYDTINWSNFQFSQVRQDADFQIVQQSWIEQRQFLDLFLEALNDHYIKAEIIKGWAELRPTKINLKDYSAIMTPYAIQQCIDGSQFNFGYDGSIYNFASLVGSVGSQKYPIGKIMYRTYNEDDNKFFESHYNWLGPDGWNTGYGKPNSTDNAYPKTQWWPLRAVAFYRHQLKACSFAVQIVNDLDEAHVYYGSPLEFWNIYDISKKEINITSQWFDKVPTRLMESAFVSFPTLNDNVLLYSKINYLVSPYDVVFNGSQWQHMVDDNGIVTFDNTGNTIMQLQSFDVPLACPITDTYGPTVWPVPLQPITDQLKGNAFSLFNNIWNVNFIFWYPYLDEDKHLQSRFRLTF